MGALLKIEDDALVALANRLAVLKGTSVQSAVSVALHETVQRGEAIQAKLSQIRALAADIRTELTEPLPSSNYDENGFPA